MKNVIKFYSAITLFIVLCLLLVTGCRRPPSEAKPLESIPFIVRKEIPKLSPLKIESAHLNQLIVIDAGHGGEDRGTISLSKPSYQEKFLTLSTAKMLRDHLKQIGYRTMMTRGDDTFIPLLSRAALANELQPSLFVSLHYNSAPSSDAHGVEVFYYQSDSDKIRSKASKELAAMILDEIIQKTQAKSRGVKNGNFAVIRETKMPAVLIEGGFLTNKEEMNRLKDPSYLKSLARGVAEGIDHYLRKNTP